MFKVGFDLTEATAAGCQQSVTPRVQGKRFCLKCTLGVLAREMGTLKEASSQHY